jgi:uncharacterized FlaG/YvyC family protein
MKISPGQNQGTPVEPPSTPANQVKTERTSTSSAAATIAARTKATESTSAVQPTERQTDVTYRQDSNGRVYYSVSDAKSGQEILEVPPKALRDVGQGIEEYLKEEQSRASVHVKVKA